jgi:hypothetical protein
LSKKVCQKLATCGKFSARDCTFLSVLITKPTLPSIGYDFPPCKVNPSNIPACYQAIDNIDCNSLDVFALVPALGSCLAALTCSTQ